MVALSRSFAVLSFRVPYPTPWLHISHQMHEAILVSLFDFGAPPNADRFPRHSFLGEGPHLKTMRSGIAA